MNAAHSCRGDRYSCVATENDLGSVVPFTIFGEPHMGGTLEANPKFAGKVSSSSEFICIFKDSYWIVSDQKLENSSV